MSPSSNLFRQFESTRNVAILASLVAPAKQDSNSVAASDEIYPIARTMVDPHLRHSATHRLHVTRIAQRRTTDSDRDPGACLTIPQSGEPGGKNISLPDFQHVDCLLQRTICQVLPIKSSPAAGSPKPRLVNDRLGAWQSSPEVSGNRPTGFCRPASQMRAPTKRASPEPRRVASPSEPARSPAGQRAAAGRSTPWSNARPVWPARDALRSAV
jgi:hypothetical protein